MPSKIISWLLSEVAQLQSLGGLCQLVGPELPANQSFIVRSVATWSTCILFHRFSAECPLFFHGLRSGAKNYGSLVWSLDGWMALHMAGPGLHAGGLTPAGLSKPRHVILGEGRLECVCKPGN